MTEDPNPNRRGAFRRLPCVPSRGDSPGKQTRTPTEMDKPRRRLVHAQSPGLGSNHGASEGHEAAFRTGSVTPADGSAFRLARAGEGHPTAAVCTLASPGTCVPRELAAGTASRALPPSPKTRSGSCPASPPAEALYLILFYLSLRVSSERPLTAPTHSAQPSTSLPHVTDTSAGGFPAP